jgi:hypothetical protein
MDDLAESPIGIFIEQRTLADDSPDLKDALIVEYIVHNRTSGPIENLYAGLYFDWDFPFGTGAGDAGGFAVENGVGWMSESGGSRYRGLAVLTPQGVASYRYFKNNPTIYDGFSDSEKWAAMMGGIELDIPESPSDGSLLISTGPYIIPAGDSVLAAFALIGATSPEGLFASAAAAHELYSGLCSCLSQGDLTQDGQIDDVDLAHLIDVVFFGGVDVQERFCPTTSGDFDASRLTDVVDLALLIDLVHLGGSPPADPCPN